VTPEQRVRWARRLDGSYVPLPERVESSPPPEFVPLADREEDWASDYLGGDYNSPDDDSDADPDPR
jgi:hypothetical protein